MANTQKMTKVDYLNKIRSLEAVQADKSMVDFLTNEIALINKRYASKASKVNEARTAFQTALLNALAYGKATPSELISKFNTLLTEANGGQLVTTQKVIGNIRLLGEAVTSEKVGKSTYYKLAPTVVAEDSDNE